MLGQLGQLQAARKAAARWRAAAVLLAALLAATAPRVYVCNLLQQPGATQAIITQPVADRAADYRHFPDFHYWGE